MNLKVGDKSMELIIDVDLIKINELSPNSYCFLVYLCQNKIEEFPWKISTETLKDLQSKGFLKITDEGFFIKPLFKSKFERFLKFIEVESWIEDWRNIFPKIMSGGRPVKGDKKGCIKKMTSFIKKNPEITKEEIFEATKIYVFKKKREDYKFMQCADYFIEKDGISLLNSLVEYFKENPNILKTSEDFENPFMRQL